MFNEARRGSAYEQVKIDRPLSLRFPKGAALADYEGTIRFDVLERQEIDTSSLKTEFNNSVQEDAQPSVLPLVSPGSSFLPGAGLGLLGGRKRVLRNLLIGAGILGATKATEKALDSGIPQRVVKNVVKGFEESADAWNSILSPNQRESFYRNNISPKRGKVRKLTGNSCTLYLPQRISVRDSVNYNEVSLGRSGALGRAAFNEAGNIGAAFDAVAQDVGQVLGVTYDAASNLVNSGRVDLSKLSPNGAAFMASELSKRVTGQNTGEVISSIVGARTNPNDYSNFQRVNLRAFEFGFVLMPTSETEAKEIEAIIKFFRKQIYPEGIPIGPIYAGYRYPRKFEITLAYKDSEVATRILPSYLTGFDTNYNPNSMTFHYRNGKAYFPEITINMSFTEERALVAQDVEYGGY